MSRTTWIWMALIACLTCVVGFESLNITGGMMSDLAATGSLSTDKATMAQALWLDFGFILAYSALFALWLRSASEAFSALEKYYDPSNVGNGAPEKAKPSFYVLVLNLFNRLFRLTNDPAKPDAIDQRTQAIKKRVELLHTFAQFTQGIGVALVITAISDGIENSLALTALSRDQGFGGWAVTATWIKFGGFFVVFGYCAFTSVVRGLWRIKPAVELTFAQIVKAELQTIDEGRTRLGQPVTAINANLAGLALSGAAFEAQHLPWACCNNLLRVST